MGIFVAEGMSIEEDEMIWPMMRCMPMGWSWAFYFCHKVLEQAALQTGLLPKARMLKEGRPAPSLRDGVVFLPYADNGVVIGTDKQAVQTALDAWMQVLRDKGLAIHEEVRGAAQVESLGFWLDGVALEVKPTRKRLWRARRALDWLLAKERKITGAQLERVLGRMTLLALARREVLAVWRSSYDFVRAA